MLVSILIFLLSITILPSFDFRTKSSRTSGIDLNVVNDVSYLSNDGLTEVGEIRDTEF